ncbi:uncharacterized protein LOC125220906 [Salvia hispanica]|uniref:uncharacterized protein LOC125220906 n=1 Tax=Salvia hispanica TaxID=49212 RepID=UPI002009D9FD|nr:uncharacterized protein LOC125220906 [Salvia hispanica]
MRALRKEDTALPSLRRAFSPYDQINIITEDQLRFQARLNLASILLNSEILVLGCGRHIQPVNPELRSFIRSTGMKLEVIDSRNAASTYNILNEEGRIVAAALIPHGGTS